MLPLRNNSTITILGAGLMGRLLAVELARKGHQVEVFEAQGPDAQGAAARVAAAMLAPLAESAVTEPGVVRMGQYALPRWQELIGKLSEPVFFQQNGTLILWHRLDAGEASRLAAYARARQHDRAAVTGFTHSLVSLFDRHDRLSRCGRAAVMATIDTLAPLRRHFASHLVFGVGVPA